MNRALLLVLSLIHLDCLHCAGIANLAVGDGINSEEGGGEATPVSAVAAERAPLVHRREEGQESLAERPHRLRTESLRMASNVKEVPFRSLDGDLLLALRWPEARGLEVVERIISSLPDPPPETMVASMIEASIPASPDGRTMPSLAGRRGAAAASVLFVFSLLLLAAAVHLYAEQVPNEPYMYFLSFSESLSNRKKTPLWLRLVRMEDFSPSTKVASVGAALSFVVALIWGCISAERIVYSRRARAAWLASPSRILDRNTKVVEKAQKAHRLNVRQELERELSTLHAEDGAAASPR